MSQKDQGNWWGKKSLFLFFFLPEAAGSTAKDRARQRTHAATKGPGYEHHSQLLYNFFFSCILITQLQKFLPNGKAVNQFFLQQGQPHKC